ncbi:MAG: hypothetical protein HYU58_18140 [Proteobacteria bacterium]|nr:hypothetical protein [Pseudomonadota bacterium]
MTLKSWLATFLVAASLGTGAAFAQDASVIDPVKNPAKARFMALAQEKFNKDPNAMFNTTRVAPGDRQAVFECGMKSVLADIPEPDVQRLVDMIEGRAPSDPKLAKWFQLEASSNPARHDQVAGRAKTICPQFAGLMK